MSTQPDRPETLPRRNRPQPAPDEAVDPVVPAIRASEGQSSQVQAPAGSVRTTRRGQATVQLGVRVTEDIADLVAAEADRRGISQRAVVEEALRAHLSG